MSTKWQFVNLSLMKNSHDVIRLCELNGAAPVINEVRGAFYCTADVPYPQESYPLKIPLKGCADNRSYWKTMFVRVSDWERFSEFVQCSAISDICIFPSEESVFGPCNLISDKWQLSTNGSGGILIGQRDSDEHGISLKDYTQATGVLGVTGYPLETHHFHFSMQSAKPRKLDCYSQTKPCVFDKSIYREPFDSRAIVTQLVVPWAAVFGRKPSLEFHIGAKIKLL